MAHPFSAVPTPFRVDTAELAYWGNCAWDALAIPALLSLDATVSARSAESGELVNVDGVVHFVVPPRRFWDNVGYT